MPGKKAFTLVEILIVVIILGILAAIVLPKFSNATAVARASMLQDDLRIFRAQVQVFRAQHRDIPAGYPGGDRSATPTEAAFVDHLTKATNSAFGVANPGTAGYNYGPYLTVIPENPVNGLRTVRVLGDSEAFPAAADDAYGWIYQPSTTLLKADCTGSDDKGQSYYGY